MKRLLVMLIILFSLYLSIQFAFKFFGKGHDINYELETDGKIFSINEIYTLNRKNETNNYYFTVNIDDTTFSFQTYENFNRSDMILKKIKHFKNDKYECILPVFRNDKIIFDVMCTQNNIITYYHDLRGKNEELDNFVSSIKEENYTISIWSDDKSNRIDEPPITVYQNNILDNHFIGINNYKGLYTINNINLKKIVNVEIFNKDVYERKLSAMVGKYYVTADYQKDYEFTRFYIVDLTSNEIEAANNNVPISFDSYIQGVVDESLYIFDKENKKQYEVDAKHNKVLEVGNSTTDVKFYNNGTWEHISINEAVNSKVLFKDNNDTSSSADYDKIDKIGNKLSGYYYLYKKNGDKYDVYRSNIQNKDVMTYIFSTNKIDNIYYVRDFVYFTDNNEVKYFHDKKGVKTLFKNEEFEFNDSLFYNVYLKY